MIRSWIYKICDDYCKWYEVYYNREPGRITIPEPGSKKDLEAGVRAIGEITKEVENSLKKLLAIKRQAD